MVEHQRPEQHFPMVADEAHQPLPVKFALGSINHVADVSAIKALAPRNKILEAISSSGASTRTERQRLPTGWRALPMNNLPAAPHCSCP